MTFFDFLPYLGSLIPIGIALGSLYYAMKWGYSKQAGAMQEKTIAALKGRVETLEEQARLDKKELTRLRQESRATRVALKRRALRIEIKDGFITLIDTQAKSSHTISIRRALRLDDATTSDEDEAQDEALDKEDEAQGEDPAS